MVKIPKIDYVAYLVNRKFPDLMPPLPIRSQLQKYDGIIHSDDQKQLFNLPQADADFTYWSKMANWILDEAFALSLALSD